MNAPIDTSKAAAAMLKEVLAPEERKALLRINPLASAWMVASNWVLVFAAMALASGRRTADRAVRHRRPPARHGDRWRRTGRCSAIGD
jgi:hypothetical protein